YQGDVDWRAVRASGIAFAYIKATEGGDRIDDKFHDNWRGAKAAGIPRGAYHFYYFCRPAAEQADWFIVNVPNDPSALPPVLDMEWNHRSPTCGLRPDAATVQAEMRVFLDMLTRHYGKRPIIYTTVDFYEHNRLHDVHGYHWWLRSVSAHPTTATTGAPSCSGNIPGPASCRVLKATPTSMSFMVAPHNGAIGCAQQRADNSPDASGSRRMRHLPAATACLLLALAGTINARAQDCGGDFDAWKAAV